MHGNLAFSNSSSTNVRSESRSSGSNVAQEASNVATNFFSSVANAVKIPSANVSVPGPLFGHSLLIRAL